MNNDTALLPPRVATLAQVAALEAHRDLRMDRLLDATRRMVYDDTMPEGRHETFAFEDLPQYAAFAARAGAFTEYEVAAFYGDDREAVVHALLDHVDACGRMFPIRDERDPDDASLACLDLDTGSWLRFARDSRVEWVDTAEPLDLIEPVTFEPFPDKTPQRPAPLWPDEVELTESEAAQIQRAQQAVVDAQHHARAVADTCARAAIERAGGTVAAAYLTRHRVTTVAREIPQRVEIDVVDERGETHIAHLAIRCVGGRTLRSGFGVAALIAADAVLTAPDLQAVASVLNLPLAIDRFPWADEEETGARGEDVVTPARHGYPGDVGLEFTASTRDPDQPPHWVIRWTGDVVPDTVYRRVAAVLEAKGVPVITLDDGLRVPMVYRPSRE